ncbi:MAG: element excision factor XisI family protein [Chloroflexota bacterium]|nr:element excision factor XisI family protein [Chloroflexota bacterium]
MAALNQIVGEEVAWYAGSDGLGFGQRMLRILDHERCVYGVVAIEHPRPKGYDIYSDVVVMACIVDNIVVIEEDATDRPLVDRLIARGIPRSQIVLAYAGEPLPDADKWSDPLLYPPSEPVKTP